MFCEVSECDRLMPYDSSGLGLTAIPAPIKNGVEGNIRWIGDDPVLPSANYVTFILLSLTSGDVKAGGVVNASWGLHLIDANIAMGNLVDVVGAESKAYLARK